MAGRGRGRGRGRGAQMSFDFSQLGFTGGEALPAPVLQPPPTFPPLENKPVPLKSGPETEYMVALKRDFVEFLHSIRQNNDSSSTIERFSDKYQIISSDTKDNWESQINWDYFPSELNPKRKTGLKRKLDKGGGTSKKSNIDITKKLEELAKMEGKDEDEEEEEIKEEDKDADDENENRENIEEEDEDEEMDDGTDYVNNYFDNGEGYFDDEDDNLEDGPVY